MVRGMFHLFACRSGQAYAQKLFTELKFLMKQRSEELQAQKYLSPHEESESRFIHSITNQMVSIGQATVCEFDDGEMDVIINEHENVRDKDVFLVQCPYNTTDNLSLSQNNMETFLYLDALRHAKARSITLVSLYFPFGRGDKQHGKDGVPAALMAKLLAKSGMSNIITMDLHADQIIGFFDPKLVRVEHLHATPLLIEYCKKVLEKDAIVVAPDAGAAKRAEFFARNLETQMIMAYKKRSYVNKHTVDDLQLLGNPEGKDVLIVDDIVASGGSVVKLIEILQKEKVKKAVVVCAHPLLIGKAIERFDQMFADKNNPFFLLVGTDAIPHGKEITEKPWYKEINTSRFIAKAIYEKHTSGSLSQLHNPNCVKKLNLWVN